MPPFSIMTETEIEQKVHSILSDRFSEFQKTQIKNTGNTLRFACPFCGDSHSNPWKKRGNLFFDTASYHCFNCSKNMNLIWFFKLLNSKLKIKEISALRNRITTNIKKSVNTTTDFDRILKIAPSFKEFITQNNISKIPKNHEFVTKRYLTEFRNKIGIKDNDIFIFNVADGKLLGFQVKKFYNTKYEHYKKYSISNFYDNEDYNFCVDTKPEDLDNYSKLSLLYGFFDINYNQPITIFEGSIDSFFFYNSVATSSSTITFDFLENNPKSRYWFDNDAAGKKKMVNMIQKKRHVFLWDKFINTCKIKQVEFEIKDLNNLIQYLQINNKMHLMDDIDKFFSNNPLDLIYI